MVDTQLYEELIMFEIEKHDRLFKQTKKDCNNIENDFDNYTELLIESRRDVKTLQELLELYASELKEDLIIKKLEDIN